MMKRKSRPPLTDIEVGSFSDVAFLLIIFFILTTQIAAFKGTIVDIPSGEQKNETKKKEDEKKQLTIFLTGNFVRVAMGDTAPAAVSFEDLKARLLAENYYARPKMEDRFVILQTGDDVSYDTYFKTVMMINDCGGVLCLMEGEDEKGGGGK